MKIIIGSVLVYALICLYLSYQAACIGVHPDGASFVCGHQEYSILSFLLFPTSLFFFLVLPIGMIHETLEQAGMHGDLVISVVMTFLNSFFWLAFLNFCRRNYIRRKQIG